jgi:hypothetical protein
MSRPFVRTHGGPAIITGSGWIVCVGACVLAGAIVTGGVPLLAPSGIPALGALSAAILIAASPILLLNWRAAAVVFLAWLLIEDLFRKLAGNDLSIYFAKDILYAVLLAAMAADRTFRNAWRDATGSARWWLYALVGWAVVMSIPTGLQDWRLPLVGLRLDFLYVPLVVIGYQMARRANDFRRWMLRLAVLGGAASLIGIVQAVIGPTFLAPDVRTPGLGNLVLVRGLPGSAAVYRPTGTFVDPGRFASMALVAIAIGLAAALVCRGWSRAWAATAALTAAGALWVSGGRAGFVAGTGLVVIAAIGTGPAHGQAFIGKAAAAAGIALASAVILAALSPSMFQSRLLWYQATLDPRSPDNEWSSRWAAYGGDTIRGVRLGGVLGVGTGQESLGRQYLYGGSGRAPAGLYQVEGGYASVATEWGVVGLALWVGWSLAWTRRQWRAVRASRGTSIAVAGLVLLGWMVFFLFFQFFGGLQAFQNYFANAYFWLLSGMLFALPKTADAEGKIRASA